MSFAGWAWPSALDISIFDVRTSAGTLPLLTRGHTSNGDDGLGLECRAGSVVATLFLGEFAAASAVRDMRLGLCGRFPVMSKLSLTKVPDNSVPPNSASLLSDLRLVGDTERRINFGVKLLLRRNSTITA
jgi:hypothetical protein